jgi:CBS domain-containing protein
MDVESAMRNLSDIVFEQDPLVLKATESVEEGCRRMSERGVGSVLVCNDAGRLVGIFTGRDAVCRVLALGRDATRSTLAEAMTPKPTTLSPDQSAIDALRLMWNGGFRHVPLVNNAGRILGVVSRGDFGGLELSRHEDERELWEHMR